MAANEVNVRKDCDGRGSYRPPHAAMIMSTTEIRSTAARPAGMWKWPGSWHSSHRRGTRLAGGGGCAIPVLCASGVWYSRHEIPVPGKPTLA
jgi:hypothetical protein